jgi:Na+/H+ antiporter NhaA
MNDVIRDFFKMESAGGILLVIAAAIAMTIANSPLGRNLSICTAYLCIWYVSFSLD